MTDRWKSIFVPSSSWNLAVTKHRLDTGRPIAAPWISSLSRFTRRLLVFSPITKLMASMKFDFPKTTRVSHMGIVLASHPMAKPQPQQHTWTIWTDDGCEALQWANGHEALVRFEVLHLDIRQKGAHLDCVFVSKSLSQYSEYVRYLNNFNFNHHFRRFPMLYRNYTSQPIHRHSYMICCLYAISFVQIVRSVRRHHFFFSFFFSRLQRSQRIRGKLGKHRKPNDLS